MLQGSEVGQSGRRLSDSRYIGALPGRVVLSARRRPESNAAPVFACRLSSITPYQAVLVSAESVQVGESVAAHFEAFGLLKATVSRRAEAGFVMDISLDDDGRRKLAAKIDWQKRKALTSVPDRRDHKRIMPRDPRSRLTLSDGAEMPCFIIDVSVSGVAVSAAVTPPKDVRVTVGSLSGRVVRLLDVGFAVQFDEVQELGQVEALIGMPQA